ncbi:gliotoxin biosynthesis protein GliK [Sarocladium implicatum]|nr:gliotoxin biosynthesis protein GliK [Sarocladium implicatum]
MATDSKAAPQKPCARAVAALCKLTTLWGTPKTGPSVHTIPETSIDRLVQDPVLDESRNYADRRDDDQPASDTVLYLAYGSNLCAETFLGVRGIKPISQVNVSVPALRLTFDLPGIPYGEPCFANVDWRKIPKNPKVPPVPKLPPNPKLPPTQPIDTPSPIPELLNSAHCLAPWDGWNGELIGVVYEVTKEDYGHIIQTEGGGASYKEIVVPCIPLPARIGVPEKGPLPELPRPFLARTLFAPYLPSSEAPKDPREDKWWYKYITPPHRPSPDYAQASARYLKLIRDGAREHELPDEYQRYLHSLQPYTITTCRQKLGHMLFISVLLPFIMAFFTFSRLFADENGNLPPVLMVLSTAIFNISWRVYDSILKPVFGDGERTESKRQGAQGSNIWEWRNTPLVCDEEKNALLDADRWKE